MLLIFTVTQSACVGQFFISLYFELAFEQIYFEEHSNTACWRHYTKDVSPNRIMSVRYEKYVRTSMVMYTRRGLWVMLLGS
jgi:hypothetical protein